jgi:hypothetical protein
MNMETPSLILIQAVGVSANRELKLQVGYFLAIFRIRNLYSCSSICRQFTTSESLVKTIISVISFSNLQVRLGGNCNFIVKKLM